MPQNRGDHQAHVADGAIPAQRDGLALHLGSDHVDGVLDDLGLAVADDERVEVGVHRTDAVDPGARGLHARRRRHQQDDHAQHATDLLERVEARLELGYGLGYGCRVVIRSDLAYL